MCYNFRKMAYTSAKDLGLLNIVHSVMDKNTLEIKDQFSSQGYISFSKEYFIRIHYDTIVILSSFSNYVMIKT